MDEPEEYVFRAFCTLEEAHSQLQHAVNFSNVAYHRTPPTHAELILPSHLLYRPDFPSATYPFP